MTVVKNAIIDKVAEKLVEKVLEKIDWDLLTDKIAEMAAEVISDEPVTLEEAIACLEKQGQVKESPISQHENKTCKENDDSLTSDDERIRYRIIGYFIVDLEEHPERGKRINEMLAWLEKQADHAKFINSIQVGDKVTRNEDGVLVNLSQLKRVAKQGEQKPYASETMNEKRDFDSGFTKMMENEQKPVDTVEPKLKKGDWITNGDYTWQIVNVTDLDYILQSQDGHIIYDTISHVEERFRSFTIEDAKDGDMLFTSSTASYETFIFKGLTIEGYIKCYCSYDSEDKYCEGKYHFIGRPTFMTHPATKEQRDILFQKMKEYGYEWDAKKKELKKIEQKPAFEMKTSEESLGIDSDTYNKIVDDCIYGEQKPTEWSEEDEKVLQDIIYNIRLEATKHLPSPLTKGKSETDLYIDWLKSLKDKLQFINQEWSKKDEDKLNRIYEILPKCIDCHPIECKELQDWLKSLRPQSTWKPSDEQMKCLSYVLGTDDHTGYVLSTLYNDLKKLKG